MRSGWPLVVAKPMVAERGGIVCLDIPFCEVSQVTHHRDPADIIDLQSNAQ